MAEQQLIGALEAGGTKMVCATGYADGTVLEREQIATTTPQETVEPVNHLIRFHFAKRDKTLNAALENLKSLRDKIKPRG